MPAIQVYVHVPNLMSLNLTDPREGEAKEPLWRELEGQERRSY
jgi:hypothetical protein